MPDHVAAKPPSVLIKSMDAFYYSQDNYGVVLKQAQAAKPQSQQTD